MYSEFRLRLGGDIVMSNYWRLNFILARSMDERDNYAEMVRVSMGIFKEDAENNMRYMNEALRLSAPPFIRKPRRDIVEVAEANQEGLNQSVGEANEASKEAEYSRRW